MSDSRREVMTVLLALIFILLSSIPVLGAVELSHDNGRPASGSAYRTLFGSTGFAVSFTAPSQNWPVQVVRVYGYRFGDRTETMEVIVEIWGPNRTVLYSKAYPYSKFSTAATWVSLEVTDVVVTGSFLAIFYPNSAPPQQTLPSRREACAFTMTIAQQIKTRRLQSVGGA
ncbi:MAG: hypothetical protein V1857_00815 [archaeon]